VADYSKGISASVKLPGVAAFTAATTRSTYRRNWPLRISEHDDRDFPARQILPIPDVFAGRYEQVESCRPGCAEQGAIDKPSQPRSIASTTVWPLKVYRSGAGML
jgi:hypothetical protein